MNRNCFTSPKGSRGHACVLLLLAILGLGPSIVGEQLPLRRYTTEDGLPSNTTSYKGTTVLQLLNYANYASAINGNPVASSNTGQVWYLQNKVRQTIATGVFDNINNDIAKIASPGSITNPSF